MSMAYIWAEVKLDEVNTQDLIEELENRWLEKWHITSLIELLRGEDKVKMGLFFKVRDKFSVAELCELLEEKTGYAQPIPKEQLKLEL